METIAKTEEQLRQERAVAWAKRTHYVYDSRYRNRFFQKSRTNYRLHL